MWIKQITPAHRRTATVSDGFTLLEMMIVCGVVGIMASIALPNFLKARATVEQRSCIKNLRELDLTKQQWGFENKKAPTAIPTIAEIQVYFGRNRMPACPTRGTYTLQRLDRNPTCTRATSGHTL
jgi:prepilin-type N-terminal cleavage/methylation domain-containing protein